MSSTTTEASTSGKLLKLPHGRSSSTGTGQQQQQQQLRHRRPSSLRDVTKMVMKLNNTASRRNLINDGGTGSLHSENVTTKHTRSLSVPFQEENLNPLAGTTIFAAPHTSSTFMDHAQHLENIFATRPRVSDSDSDFPDSLLHPTAATQPHPTSIREEDEEDDDEGGEVIQWTRSRDEENGGQHPFSQETTNLIPKIAIGGARPNKTNKYCGCCRLFPASEIAGKFKLFLSTTFGFFIVPGLLLAAFFFYSLDNPDLVFLPSTTPLSWYCLFAVRQAVTLTLAQITQYILVVLSLKTTLFVRFMGPLVALVVMQSKGWPFLIGSWGCWNFLLLHGDSPFVKHWLYWTGIRLFSMEYNSGNGILASEEYGQILASMILLGVAVATKRTFVALYMSRRTLQYYRTQLESVMGQIKLVSEVAELAEKTTEDGFDTMIKENFSQLALERKEKAHVETVPTFENKNKETKKKESKGKREKSQLDMEDDLSDEDEDDPLLSADKELDEVLGDKEQMEINIDPKLQWQALKERSLNDRDTVNFAGNHSTMSDSGATAASKKGASKRDRLDSRSMSSSKGMAMIFPFLDRWHEPKDKAKKAEAATLHDILQFRKAMQFMEMDSTFGDAYGSCANRKQCVKNAVRVYRRLLKFTPDKSMVSFEVIGALAYEEDGELDEDRAIALLHLFFPDKDDQLPMLAFVQGCDNVYKQMRFLRASLSNSTKIDGVLEDMFNLFFYFCLSVAVTLICGFNPWPILVSLSTLTLSFTFAFGNSVAKNVEGILMIAVRRPYDIGDRITICGAESVANPTGADTWLVEDISLTTTTLRYSTTNELASLNNSSIANSRVVNYKRSSKAMVASRVQFNIGVTQQQLDEFRYAMEAYFENRPREWIGLIHYRADVVDNNAGMITYLYRAQHVKSWQELGAIMISKGEWERHATKLATEMEIIFNPPPNHMTIGLSLDASRASKDNMATEDRKQVAEFIRSINKGPSGGDAQSSSPFETIAEYFTDSGTAAAATIPASDGNFTDSGTAAAATIPASDGNFTDSGAVPAATIPASDGN